MPIEIVDPLKFNNWNNLVLSSDNKSYSVFHSLEWAKVLAKSYKYTPNYFIYKSDNNVTSILSFMLLNNYLSSKRFVSLPFSDYCEPIICQKNNFKPLINFLNSYCEKENIKSFEIRGGKEHFEDVQCAYSYYDHILELGGKEEVVFKKFNETTRRNIKKAIKEGIQTSIDFDFKSLEEFYRLNCMTRKKHGLPPQPFVFFLNIFQELIKEKKAFIISARFKENVIASAIYLYFGEKAYYKYGASDERFQNYRSNNLVMWEAIKYFNEKKFKTFQFGRTEFENDGLRRFKLGWGTEEKIINTYIFSVNKKTFIKRDTKTTGFHNKIFRKLPIPLLKILSGLIYKYIG